MFPNFAPLLTEALGTGSAAGPQVLAPGLRIGIGEANGILDYVGGNGLTLDVRSKDGPFQWAEIVFGLDDPDWRTCRAVYLRLTVSADRPVSVAPALRLGYADRFVDRFAETPVTIGPEPVTAGACFALSPRCLYELVQLDLHLFLTTEEHRFTLHDLALTGTF